MEIAGEVARLLAQKLERDAPWERDQVARFQELAAGYLPETMSSATTVVRRFSG